MQPVARTSSSHSLNGTAVPALELESGCVPSVGPESPSKTRPRRRPGLGSGSNLPTRAGGSQIVLQLPWPPAGSALLIAAMLVSFVFLHTEVEWIEVEDPEGMGASDDPVSVTEGAAALLGASVGDKRLLQEPEEDDPSGAAAAQRRLAAQGRFWEKPAGEDDKPSWQRALEEQARRRAEEQARKASMWGGGATLAALEQGNASAGGGATGLFAGLRGRRHPGDASRRQHSMLSSASAGDPGALNAAGIWGAGVGAGGAAAVATVTQATAGDPQAAAKAAAAAASTGGRVENREEWEKVMTKMAPSIIADVTVVVTPKHWLGCSLYQLQQLLENSPEGMKILYFVTPSMQPEEREHLQTLASRTPNLELKEGGQFASGFHLRNASVEFVKTKYALFIFNDVVPQTKFWLQELYSFAEQRPEGVIFLPYVWQKGRATSIPPAAARKRAMMIKASSSSASGKSTSSGAYSVFGSRSASAAVSPGSSSLADPTASASSLVEAEAFSFPFPENTVSRAHGPFALDVVFDDFSNDGKLYVQRIEDTQVTGTRDPAQLEPRESSAAVEDHCLLVRQSLLEEALVFDPKSGWTRQELDIALTVRYYNYRSFLVPQSQVTYLHPSLGLPFTPPQPAQLAYFTSQSNDDACSINQVHLRQKWGIVTGQLCRGFVDSTMRHVSWGASDLAALTQGEQLQLVLSFFSLLGLNRFQVRGLGTWNHPPLAAPSRCKPSAHDKDRDSSCQPVPHWMANASSDFIAMVAGASNLGDALQAASAGGQKKGGEQEPELWMGRAELLPPLRVNRVEDLWRAASLREGQLFTVRRGTVKSGEKHPGRRAPELPHLMRMYLPFTMLEFEMELSLKEMGSLEGTRAFGLGGPSKGGGSSLGKAGVGSASPGKMCFFQGMSVVIQERCIVTESSGSADSENDKGFLLEDKGRPCLRSTVYFRAFMFVRHTDMDQTPIRMFEKLRKSFQRNMVVHDKDEGWMEGKRMSTWLSPCFASAIKRMRLIRCVPGQGDSCTLGLPLGSSQGGWSLVLWSWKPQSVRTTQVHLLQPGASRIVI